MEQYQVQNVFGNELNTSKKLEGKSREIMMEETGLELVCIIESLPIIQHHPKPQHLIPARSEGRA